MEGKNLLLELRGITKSFGDFIANDHIDLTLRPGEIHAVLGENGAGKSTLMNIIYGMYTADEGEILVESKKVHIRSPKDAIAHGIGMVHQHFMLVDVFDAVENIYLLTKDSPMSFKDKGKVERELVALQEQYGIDVDIHCPIEKLGIGMQQKVEILKLLYTGARVLIFDEPTAVLIPQEAESLFRIIESLSKNGKGIIFISHKLDEVLEISHRITVLTKGKIVGSIDRDKADKETIVRMMVGEELDIPQLQKNPVDPSQKVILRCENVVAQDDRDITTLRGVSLEVRAGEILGIAGVEGNGQDELTQVLGGVRKAQQGSVWVKDRELSTDSSVDFLDSNVAYVPSDRNQVGSVPEFPLYENWILRSHRPPKKGKLLDYPKIKEETSQAMESYDVRARSSEERSANLSGGNLQKFILARELSKDPVVLILEHPTRGLDIKASWFIRETIFKAKEKGMAVVLMSGDFEELFTLSDRIVVLFNGEIVGERSGAEATVAELGSMMMGVNAVGKE